MGAAANCNCFQTVTPQRITARYSATPAHTQQARCSKSLPLHSSNCSSDARSRCSGIGHLLKLGSMLSNLALPEIVVQATILGRNTISACRICRTVQLPVGTSIRTCNECGYVVCQKCYSSEQENHGARHDRKNGRRIKLRSAETVHLQLYSSFTDETGQARGLDATQNTRPCCKLPYCSKLSSERIYRGSCWIIYTSRASTDIYLWIHRSYGSILTSTWTPDTARWHSCIKYRGTTTVICVSSLLAIPYKVM